MRTPAWCDRVLWRVAAGSGTAAKLLKYGRAPLNPSDHKPVYAVFACSLKKVVEWKERQVFEELVATLSRFQHSCARQLQAAELPSPKVAVMGLEIAVAKVLYDTRQESFVTIANTGETVAVWHFVRKLEERSVCKRWISLSATSGLLLPGEVKYIALRLAASNRVSAPLPSAWTSR